jgi:hypothetical protein
MRNDVLYEETTLYHTPDEKGTPSGMKLPWSMRDHPAALTAMLIGVLMVTLALGWLTVRIGMHWTSVYIQRQSQFSQ